MNVKDADSAAYLVNSSAVFFIDLFRSPRRSVAIQEDEESVRSYGYRRTYREDIRAG